MPRLQQGSIVWATLPAPSGRRPVIVLTRDSVVGRLNRITVAPITRIIRNIKTEVKFEPADGVPTSCVAALDNIFTIQRISLSDVIAVADRDKMVLIFEAIRYAFDMLNP